MKALATGEGGLSAGDEVVGVAGIGAAGQWARHRIGVALADASQQQINRVADGLNV